MMNRRNIGRTGAGILLLLVLFGGLSFYLANAIPEGATITGSPSVDTGPTKTPANRADLGGRIITLVLNSQSQDFGWKAYVGNASGKFVLQNANNMSIYEWPSIAVATGEVYVSRNNSLNFTSGAILCANASTMGSENGFFGFLNSSADSINGTFNATNHSAFQVGAGNSISANSCPSTALWVNSTIQTPSQNAIFQEIVISDHNTLIYVSKLNDNQRGFDNVSSYDFQMIIPENKTATTGTTYYFYLELDS